MVESFFGRIVRLNFLEFASRNAGSHKVQYSTAKTLVTEVNATLSTVTCLFLVRCTVQCCDLWYQLDKTLIACLQS